MKFLKYVTLALSLMALFIGQTYAAPDFLPPEKAFQAQANWTAENQIVITLTPAKGYYLYQDSLHFRAGQDEQKLLIYKPALPQGIEKFDQTFQKKLVIYKKPLTIDFAITPIAGKPFNVEVELQGCAEAGICYPPMTLKFLLTGPGVKSAPISEADDSANINPAEVAANKSSLLDLWNQRDDVNAINRFLENTSPIYLFLAFFILGLALAFTPCILPMLPIMSSVVFGTQGQKVISKRRASVLAMAYVLGMAVMYALAGVLMAALGGSVQRTLQSPVALIGFALLLLALSGSLFGFYHLRLPHAWHHQIDRLAGKQKGGSFFGALALGGISTLVASPCITAPLAGVLTFIAQTGSMTLGAGLLFVMALGMGLPLLFIAIEARVFIPSTGMWMVWLQRFLGVLLVATALWIAAPVFQKSFFGLQDKAISNQLKHSVGELEFTRIGSIAELEQYLAQARLEKKLVLLDFYADWCISCKEMEFNTFSDALVSQELRAYILLQADVTKNTADNQALLKRFGLFGPPGILIFNVDSKELKDQRVIGYVPPQRFLERLKSANASK
ncbi:thiol:disulfide interchange protein DsbD [Polynucleobacter meluiroseus]|uniref:Thiol:disulfide interchange protein DsbD n=1 Tax=Polynucleobacter meluiroseus TaxID=1938814 RepID=A0A240E0B0_9BURK|nr:protein-disulfide reductase DsbD [Polynucleobacter meluiroseus]SNX28875.1 thiol:disulfide interchange protein DsbD [Polynucleobacter meluiroseus]